MKKGAFLLAAGLVLFAGLALAMTSAGFRIPWDVVAGGGGQRQSASYQLQDTAGQGVLGRTESASYQLASGYWPGVLPAVTPTSLCIVVGQVDLQGRSDDSGASVSLYDSSSCLIEPWLCAPNYTTTTALDGAFTLTNVSPGLYIATASMPGYLYAQRGSVVVTAGATTVLPTVKLPGGDADRDNDIDIYDLTLLGANFGLAVPPADARADINGDGVVNIFDLVLIGANYGLAAPVAW